MGLWLSKPRPIVYTQELPLPIVIRSEAKHNHVLWMFHKPWFMRRPHSAKSNRFEDMMWKVTLQLYPAEFVLEFESSATPADGCKKCVVSGQVFRSSRFPNSCKLVPLKFRLEFSSWNVEMVDAGLEMQKQLRRFVTPDTAMLISQYVNTSFKIIRTGRQGYFLCAPYGSIGSYKYSMLEMDLDLGKKPSSSSPSLSSSSSSTTASSFYISPSTTLLFAENSVELKMKSFEIATEEYIGLGFPVLDEGDRPVTIRLNQTQILH